MKQTLAYIHPDAKIGKGVIIEPFSTINKNVESIKSLLNIIDNFFNDNVKNIPNEWKIFKQIFDKKNISRKECLLLPFKTVSKALKL